MASADISKKMIRVLLVEDSRIVRLGLSSFLKNDAMIDIVAEAESGEEALQQTLATAVDLVVLDLGLPGISGLETMVQIKQTHPDIKIIILTSHQQKEEVLASLSAGARAYCLKDIKAADLIYVIKLVHEGGVWLDPVIAAYALEVFDHHHESPNRSADTTQSIGQLTPREHEVLKHIADGKNNKEISEVLYISPHTVKATVSNILSKLAVQDRVQAAVLAIKNNLI